MKLRELFKTEDIIKITPEDTLASALGLLKSSHDAAFVFKDDKLEGIINPYYALIKKSYPANTKVKTCLVKPPRLNISDSIEKACRLMVESKIYFLPVYENDRFIGIISARRILKYIRQDARFDAKLDDKTIRSHRIVTIKDTAYLSKALALFKKFKISKLVVISSSEKIAGMLTYYDLINLLSLPIERQNYASRTGDKHPLLKKPVKNFIHARVYSLTSDHTYKDVINELLEKEIGSIVITNNNQLYGIVTVRQILRMYAEKNRIPTLAMQSSQLSKGSETLVQLFINRFNRMLGTRSDVAKAHVTVTESKQGGLYKAVFSFFQRGKHMVVAEEGKNLQALLKDIKHKTRILLSKNRKS